MTRCMKIRHNSFHIVNISFDLECIKGRPIQSLKAENLYFLLMQILGIARTHPEELRVVELSESLVGIFFNIVSHF